MTRPTTEHHYEIHWRSSATGAVGHGIVQHDRDVAEEWTKIGDERQPTLFHWVVDLGPCDCPDELV